MAYTSYYPAHHDSAAGHAGPAGRLWALFTRRHTAAPAAMPVLPTGPAPEALIDADVERLCAYGTWDALRNDLRARDQSRAAQRAPRA